MAAANTSFKWKCKLNGKGGNSCAMNKLTLIKGHCYFVSGIDVGRVYGN